MAMRTLTMFAAVTSAFEIPAVVSRRSMLARVAAAVPLAAVAPVFADSNNGYLGPLGQGTAPTGVTDTYTNKGTRMNTVQNKVIDDAGSAAPAGSAAKYSAMTNPRAVAGVRLAGKYSDPAHPGCTRTVTTIGTEKVLITGADEDGKPWKVRGTYSGKTITVDFTPKGGPAGVTATYAIGKGLTFPDGNTWSKL